MKLMKNKLNNTNKEKGITLIALVITIIVLLILAGVMVSQITGGDSVMEKAQNAKTATDNSNDEEMVKMAVVQAMADEKTLGMLTRKSLSDALEGKATVSDGTAPWRVETSSAIYSVDENGKFEFIGEAPKISLSGLSGIQENAEIKVGEKLQLSPTKEPNDSNEGIIFETSDETVATVSSSGEITALKEGTAIITVKGIIHSNIKQLCNLTVKKATQNLGIAINRASQYGEYINLGTNLVPNKTSDMKTDWRVLFKTTENNLEVIYAILADYLPNSNGIASRLGLITSGDYYVNSNTNSGTLAHSLLSENEDWKLELFNGSTLENNSKYSSVTAAGGTNTYTILDSYNAKYTQNPTYVLNYSKYSNPFYVNKNSSEGLDDLYSKSRSGVSTMWLAHWLRLYRISCG